MEQNTFRYSHHDGEFQALQDSHDRLLRTLETIIIEVQRCERIQGGAGKETYGYGLIRATARDAIEQARKVKTP